MHHSLFLCIVHKLYLLAGEFLQLAMEFVEHIGATNDEEHFVSPIRGFETGKGDLCSRSLSRSSGWIR